MEQKPLLNNRIILTLTVLSILEILLFLYVVRSYVLNHIWNFTSILFYFPGLALSIPGIYFSYKLIRENKFHIVVLITLLMSILTFPFIGIPISFFTAGTIVEFRTKPEREKIKEQALIQKTKQQEIYSNMINTFEQPQEILGSEVYSNPEGGGDYPIIVLKNGDVIEIPNNDSLMVTQTENEENRAKRLNLINYINKSLLNEKIKIELQPFDKYQDNRTGYYGIYTCDDELMWQLKEIREKYNLKQSVGYCGFINAKEIYYNNKGLYQEYLN